MSQFKLTPLDPVEESGTELATGLGSMELAFQTDHSGSTRPTYIQAGMLWLDTSVATAWVWKRYDGSSDIPIYMFNPSSHLLQQRASEVDVASAGTCNILGAASDFIRITGTTTITSFGSEPRQLKFVRFAAALTLTHNATTLALPTGASITTAAGDSCIVSSDASGNARVFAYQRASGEALFVASVPAFDSATSMLFFNSTAPTGWTKQTTHNDKAIRLVSGTPSSGGSLNFSTVFGYQSTNGVTLTQANLPSGVTLTGTTNTTGNHHHQYTDHGSGSNTFDGAGGSSGATPSQTDRNTEDAGNHSHTVTVDLGGSGTAFTAPIDMRVRYVDAIICNKD